MKKFVTKYQVGLLITLIVISTLIGAFLPVQHTGLKFGIAGDNVYQGSGWTNTYIPYVDANGELSGDADLTFTGGNTLTSTIGTFPTLNAPTGRSSTCVVAASGAPARVKAQADYVCDGITDETEIQAAIDAVVAAGGGTVYYSAGIYYIASHGGSDWTSIIKLPSRATTEAPISIKLIGENYAYPNIGGNSAHPASTEHLGGTVFYFPEAATDQWSLNLPALVGTTTNARTAVNITIENITLQQVWGSTGMMNGFGLGYVAQATLRNCHVLTEKVPGGTAPSGYNTNNAAGFCVDGFYGWLSTLENCSAFDIKLGFVVGSHTMLKNCLAYRCQSAIVAKGMQGQIDHLITLDRFVPEGCQQVIEVNSDQTDPVTIDGTIVFEQGSGDFAPTYFVVDTNNLLYGTLTVAGHDVGDTVQHYFALAKSGGNHVTLQQPMGVAPGEIRTYSGTIATLTENAYNSVDNPFGTPVRVLDLNIYVSTGATSTSPNIDCGIGSSATTDYTNLFDDLPGETIGYYRSTIATPGTQTVPLTWASGSGNRYLNMSIKAAAATGMVATYTITVMGN